MILLDGKNIGGYDQQIRVNLTLASSDISGASSIGETAELGIKPQILSISLKIKQDDEQTLKQLITLARKIESKGNRRIYKITNNTAKAGGIYQVVFHENFIYEVNDFLKIWQVNFTLKEYLSVSEKQEQRQNNGNSNSVSSDVKNIFNQIKESA